MHTHIHTHTHTSPLPHKHTHTHTNTHTLYFCLSHTRHTHTQTHTHLRTHIHTNNTHHLRANTLISVISNSGWGFNRSSKILISTAFIHWWHLDSHCLACILPKGLDVFHGFRRNTIVWTSLCRSASCVRHAVHQQPVARITSPSPSLFSSLSVTWSALLSVWLRCF